MPIKDCFDIIPELKEKFLELYREDMPEKEQREIGIKLAMEHHKALFDKLSEVKKRVLGEEAGEYKVDTSDIQEINSKYDQQINELERKRISKSDIAKIIPNKSKPYTQINEADSQVWQSPTSYRETLYRSGAEFTTQQEKQWQWEMAYERQKEEENGIYSYTNPKLKEADQRLLKENPFPDNKVTFQGLKLKSAGMQYKDGKAISTIDKASWAPLFYRWAEGSQMLEAYRVMRTKGTDYMRVKSAHKVGTQSDALTPLYDEEGRINKEGMMALRHEEVPYKTLGVQKVENTKYKGNTEGNQLRKIAVADLLDNGEPIDGKSKEESPIYKLYRQHEDALNALTNKRYDDLLKKWDVHQNEDGSYTFNDKQKISDFLLREIERRGLPPNTREGLEVDPDTGDFKSPLEANVRFRDILNILYSQIDKNIVRPKVSGGPKTMLANTMFEKEHRIYEGDVNGKKALLSNDLAYYTVGEDGRTKACEVYIPYFFRDKLDHLRKNFKSDQEFKQHILAYLNKTAEGRKLLSGIGFRIPTQGTNSVDFFIIKDFLPEQMGDTIVLPSEITTKAGSDFDIDKLNTYLRNYYIDKEDGYPKVVKPLTANDEQGVRDYYEKYMLEDFKAYKAWLEDNDIFKNASKLLDRAFAKEKVADEEDVTEEEEPDYVPSIDEFLITSKDMPLHKLNTIKALENNYFDILEKVLSLPEKRNALLAPNDSSYLKSLSSKIKGLKDPEYKEREKTVNYGNLLDSKKMLNERHDYLQGKGAVGVAAVANTFHAVSQTVPVIITDPKLILRFPHNSVGDYPTISGLNIKDTERPISNVISQVIDGFVDVSKDKYLIEMGVDRNTAKNFIFPVRTGGDPYRAALMLNQPAVQEYLRLEGIYKTNPFIAKPKFGKALWNEVARKFGGSKREAVIASNKPVFFGIKDMEEAISQHARDNNSLTKPQKMLQLQILDEYLNYNSAAWNLFHYYRGYNWDNQRSGSPDLVRRHLIRYEAAQKLPMTSVGEIMSKTFIGGHMEKILDTSNMLKDLFPIEQKESGYVLDQIARDMSAIVRDDDTYNKEMMKATLSLTDYLTNTKAVVEGVPLNNKMLTLMTGKTSTASRLKKLLASKDKRLVTNQFLQNIRLDVDPREGYPHSIQLKQRDYDPHTSEVLTDALRELRDNATIIGDERVSDVYKDLVLTTILQSGLKKNQHSFTHLLPNEDYTQVVKGAVANIGDEVTMFNENYALYRANWRNDNIVPRLSKEKLIDEQTQEAYYRIPTFDSKKFNDLMKDKTVLRVDAYTYSKHKALKMVEYTRDKKSGKIIGEKARLFKRVDVDVNDPLIHTRTIPNDFGGSYERRYAVFTEINKWGDGGVKIQEYHADGIDSSFPKLNPHIEEATDQEVIDALYDANIDSNASPKEFRVPSDPEERTESTPLPNVKDEPMKECVTGTFSVKNQK